MYALYIWMVIVSAEFIVVTSSSKVTSNELHKEARNATLQNAACGRNDFCAYHRGIERESPGIIPYKSFIKVPCYCDEPACYEFGDCCVDLVDERWMEPRPDFIRGYPASSWSCQRFVNLHNFTRKKMDDKKKPLSLQEEEQLPLQEEEQLPLQQYVYMVSSCGFDVHPELLRMCEARSHELGDEYNYLHDLPRFADGTMFRNEYCAACYGYTYEKLLPVTLGLRCNDNLTLDEVLALPYMPEYGLWGNASLWCSLNVLEYEDLRSLNEQSSSDVRQCVPSLRDCPSDWNDTLVAAKCASYSLSVQQQHSPGILNNVNITRFKNPHCAMCHGVQVSICSVVTSRRVTTESFSLLFHFSAGGSVVGQSSCTEGTVWDALLRKCRNVFTCKPDSKFKAGKCSLDPSDLKCDRIVLLSHEFHVLHNGSLFVNKTADIVHSTKFSLIQDTGNAEVCVNNVSLELIGHVVDSSFSELQGHLTLICIGVSLVGLALHISVMITLPRLRNLPGLIALATSVALFSAQFLFLVATSKSLRPENFTSCVLLAILLHFCFLKVFAWTSVMSYDIWRTFSHPVGHVGGRRSISRRTRFIKYLVFTTTVPVCIVICSVILHVSYPTLIISPGYAESSLCWFGSRLGLAFFFAFPVCVMLVANIIMYGIVVLHIREQRRATRCLAELGEPTSCTPRFYSEGDCKLHFSIFNVMGGTWILGLLAGLIDHPILWYSFIILNGSQGALIFILQILKPRVWEMICSKNKDRQDSSKTGMTLLTSSQNANSNMGNVKNRIE